MIGLVQAPRRNVRVAGRRREGTAQRSSRASDICKCKIRHTQQKTLKQLKNLAKYCSCTPSSHYTKELNGDHMRKVWAL